jgi:D-alanyl-D-alanine carboxypeptidase
MTDVGTALGEALERCVESGAVVGMAVAQGSGDRIETAWRPASLAQEPSFLAYSITKTFTAALVMLLHEEGRLSLESPVNRWFPRITAAERISIRQLLGHTAGIRDYGGLPAYHEAVRSSPSIPWSFDEFAAATFDHGLLFEPGTAWAYSNPGYMLLKRIAEEVTGGSFATLVTMRIARPLGLRDTFVAESIADLTALAPAQSRAISVDGRPVDVRRRYHPGWVSHGVVAASPSDIARFYQALFTGRLVLASSLREMTTGVPVPDAPPQWHQPVYGLGLMGDLASPWGELWGHGGGGPGYTTSAVHAPDPAGRAVTVCAMVALEAPDVAEQLAFGVLDVMRGRPRPAR